VQLVIQTIVLEKCLSFRYLEASQGDGGGAARPFAEISSECGHRAPALSAVLQDQETNGEGVTTAAGRPS